MAFIRKYGWMIGVVGILVTSLSLSLHNATLYEPSHGFDGRGHKFYIEYIHSHRAIPPSYLDWETHQQPLYYIMGAVIMEIVGTWKAAQYLNTFVLLGIVGMVGLGLWRIFHKKEQVLIGMLATIALPMLNIFPAMITNELLNTFFILSTLISSFYLLTETHDRHFFWYLIWFAVSVILGLWTKISIILAGPSVLFVFGILFFNKQLNIQKLITLIIGGMLIVLSAVPVYFRLKEGRYINPHINEVEISSASRPADFYYRMDWIPKVDMYNTQYYSMMGGAWNSFWSDGHNALTPFVPFHKKAFILWSLGFILLPVCISGFLAMWQRQRLATAFMMVTAGTMLAAYVYYNMSSNHYSSVRLTYEMGIVLPYAFGLAGASQYKRFFFPIMAFVLIQFVVMVSFYWIEPWWHVTR